MVRYQGLGRKAFDLPGRFLRQASGQRDPTTAIEGLLKQIGALGLVQQGQSISAFHYHLSIF